MSRIRFRSISGSLLVTGSVSGNTLTFEKGDGTSFDLRVDTGSGAIVTDITDLNNYTGSANTRFDNLEAATGSYATTGSNQFTGTQFFSGSLIPEATGANNGIYDLGSLTHPWRGLYLSPASLKFVKDNEVFSTLSGERDAIRIGNVLITTSSLAFVNNNGDVVSTIATAEISGSDIVGGQVDNLSGIREFTGSAESRLDSIEGATGSYITAVIAGDGLSGGASTGDATLTLDSGSTHFISAVLGSGLFRLTGSVYATTNDVAITGSLDINFVESDQEFRVYSQSSIQFSINNEGVAVLAPRDGEPTAVSGGMYFSTDGNFYFGIQQ